MVMSTNIGEFCNCRQRRRYTGNILYEYTVLETLSVVVVTVHTTAFNFKQHEMSYLLLIYGVFFFWIYNKQLSFL